VVTLSCEGEGGAVAALNAGVDLILRVDPDLYFPIRWAPFAAITTGARARG
jgi:hypothetical protein